MAFYLKSTAFTRMFKMIDSADHLAKKTGLTCTVNLSKAGAAFGAAGGTVSEVANGWYKVALSTTDTNTAGDLAFYITATGADDTDFVDQVVDPAAANLGVNLVNIAGSAVSASTAQLGVNVVNFGGSAGAFASGRPETNMTHIDGQATTGNNATLNLKKLNIVNSAGDAVVASSTGSNGQGISASGNGTGNGILASSGAGATGNGLAVVANSTNGYGIRTTGSGGGSGLLSKGGPTGNGFEAAGGDTSGSGAVFTATTKGHGAKFVGIVGPGVGDDEAHGIKATGGANDVQDGIRAVAGGTGVPIRGNITGNLTGNVTGSVGSIATGGIAALSFAAGAVDAAALATDAATEIRDAIANLAMVEPTAVPAVTATLKATLSWVLALSRNKVTQTATTQILKADDGTTTIATSTHSDDGTTHTRGEFA